ncbi:MAG: GntR family transcriptional regulator [Kineosporiaceae bacterium]|nr:GntR family transcriptional regulator [Aeromicrobium sp.]
MRQPGAGVSPRKFAPDRSNGTPLYIQLANNLRSLILEGTLEADGTLPSERILSEQVGASRVTIRKAIEQLVREGLLLRRHGSGTFVARRIEQAGDALSGFTSDMQLRGAHPTSIWLRKVLCKPTNEEAGILNISLGSQVARLSRIRLDDGEALAIEHAVVPAPFLPPLRQVGNSLYAALESLGKRPVEGSQRLHASLATPVEAGMLSVEPGSAVLRIERRSRLADGTPVELTRSVYRGDRYDFVTPLHQTD